MSGGGSIYGWEREQAFERFGERLDGNASGLVVVVSCEPLGERARDALLKSFSALGHGEDACTFASVDGLDPKEVFSLVEGLDPLYLVATDEAAATLCAQAARSTFPLMRGVRLFGRDACAFPQLNAQLDEERDRQAVWHVLKGLTPAPGYSS